MFIDRQKVNYDIFEKFERTNHEIIQLACKQLFDKSKLPVVAYYESCASPKI